VPAEAAGEGHLSPEDVYGFIEKTLSRSRLRQAETHLDACPQCVRYLATLLSADQPASPEEEAALARMPAPSPAEIMARLRARIIATSPGSASRKRPRLGWKRMIPAVAALGVIIATFVLMQYLVIAPMRSRRLVAQAINNLVAVRQGTGRVPLRYIPEFRRARVTRSGFDTPDPTEQEIEAAIESRFRRAVELAPRGLEARLGLGLFLLDRGDMEEAETQLRQALELDPGSVEAQNGLAVLYYERALRNPDRAEAFRREGLALLQELSQSDPDNLMVAYNLAVFYQDLGLLPEARQAWTVYLAKDPTSEWAEVASDNLRSLGFN
jgi:tetratricopeptide (TPR) repeat protein